MSAKAEPKQESLAPSAEIVRVEPTPTSILELAVRQGANVETLAKLLELQERFEATQARKAFDHAFAAFKSEVPRIEKTKSADFGQGKAKYKWAPLDEICHALDPVLAKHGLSYNWEQDDSGETIRVTCILRHVLGHERRNTLSGPPDNSGSKNPLQSREAAVSYLRRYTLTGVTGTATADQDTDGMTMNNAADFLSNMESAMNREELAKRYKEAVTEALRAHDPNAVKAFMRAREKREKELAA